MKTKLLAGSLLLVMGLVLMSFVQEKKPWVVPDNYKAMKNPQKVGDKSMINLGKMMYSKHCKSCHGNFGEGDGPKARSINADLGNFTSAAFQKQSDGVIYYQSFVGRDDMPNFEKKITDEEERWAIVTYIRTLKK